MKPIIHYATDRRCYNGALCSDLTRELRSYENFVKEIRKKHPKFRVTYFPLDGTYVGHIGYSPWQEVTRVHTSKDACLEEAWENLMTEDRDDR